MDFIPHYENISVEYDEGTTTVVTMHDGSRITLTKLACDHNAHDRIQALTLLDEAREKNLFYTGLLYYSRERDALDDRLNLVDEPLATLPQSKLRPSLEVFHQLMKGFQ
jgi:2-oxoglutarate/2-oxoacid ferredoxin oxidoreductase subunit beta